MEVDRQGEVRKRRRLNEGESDYSTQILLGQDVMDSDGSIEVVDVRRREADCSDEDDNGDDDDDDFILRALNDTDAESDGGAEVECRDASSGDSTDANVIESVPSDEEDVEQAGFLEMIDLEAEVLEEQAVDTVNERSVSPTAQKAVRDYLCPICFDPPENSVITPCGHTFCASCLFQMVNSSRTPRKSGQCALCRHDVGLRDIKMVILKKKRVRKKPDVG